MESVCFNFLRHIRRQYISSGIIGRYDLYFNNCIYHFKLKDRIEDSHKLINKDFNVLILPKNNEFTIRNNGKITLITKNYNINLSIKFKYQTNFYELRNYYPLYNHIRESYLLVDIENEIDIKIKSNKIMMILMSNQY